MKFLHAKIKINEPHAHAHDADDGQLQFLAGLLHHCDAVIGVFIKRILKNIHAIEAEFLCLVQPVNQPDTVLFPSGVYHSQFHKLSLYNFVNRNSAMLFGAQVSCFH